MRIDLNEKEYNLIAARQAVFQSALQQREIAKVMLQQAENTLSQHAQSFAELVVFFSPVENPVLGPLDQVKAGRDVHGFHIYFVDQKPMAPADPGSSNVKVPMTSPVAE